MSAQDLLIHLKQTILKFNAGYQLISEAKQELDAVYQNFKLNNIELPEAATMTQQATTGSQPAFTVLLWATSGLGSAKFTGVIADTELKVVLFEGKKEGTVLQGSVVPEVTPAGSSLSENSIGFVAIKQRNDRLEMSVKFDAKEQWFNGVVEKVNKKSDKSPDIKCELFANVATAPKANTLALLETPSVTEEKAAVNDTLGLTASAPTAPAMPWDEPVASPKQPTVDDLLSTPNTDVLTQGAGQLPSWLQ